MEKTQRLAGESIRQRVLEPGRGEGLDRVYDCVNACRGIEDLTSINPS